MVMYKIDRRRGGSENRSLGRTRPVVFAPVSFFYGITVHSSQSQFCLAFVSKLSFLSGQVSFQGDDEPVLVRSSKYSPVCLLCPVSTLVFFSSICIPKVRNFSWSYFVNLSFSYVSAELMVRF